MRSKALLVQSAAQPRSTRHRALRDWRSQALPAGGQRLWFFDHGPPLAIVTRATEAKRAALREHTGIRLDTSPPAW